MRSVTNTGLARNPNASCMGGCYYVDEPETNPDAMYEGSQYSATCLSCGNVSYTNNYDEYMRWTSSLYCSTCRSQYGY